MKKIVEFLSQNKKEMILFVIVLLISSLSFALGYLYFQEFKNTPIIIEKCSS